MWRFSESSSDGGEEKLQRPEQQRRSSSGSGDGRCLSALAEHSEAATKIKARIENCLQSSAGNGRTPFKRWFSAACAASCMQEQAVEGRGGGARRAGAIGREAAGAPLRGREGGLGHQLPLHVGGSRSLKSSVAEVSRGEPATGRRGGAETGGSHAQPAARRRLACLACGLCEVKRCHWRPSGRVERRAHSGSQEVRGLAPTAVCAGDGNLLEVYRNIFEEVIQLDHQYGATLRKVGRLQALHMPRGAGEVHLRCSLGWSRGVEA